MTSPTQISPQDAAAAPEANRATDTVADTAADPDLLVTGGWLLPTGAPGLAGFTAKFESVLARLQATLTAADPSGSPGPSWYPPVVPRAQIDRAEYTEGFPQLLGVIHAPPPADSGPAGADSMPSEPEPTETVLAPAVCYSVYPRLADRVLERANRFDIAGHCYRHEATSEPGRLRSFRMREFVLVGGEQQAAQFRDSWIPHCEKLFTDLGLPFTVQAASDPFFGPGARFLRSSQMQQRLKYEFVVPVHAADPGTAVASANCHKDHLGQRFAIGWASGGTAHSACIAFGLERIVLALIHAHGDRLEDWPVLG